jgi:putative transposase
LALLDHQMDKVEALQHYDGHYHTERPHQGEGNIVLVPAVNHGERCEGLIRCRERLGGLLKCYYREAA